MRYFLLIFIFFIPLIALSQTIPREVKPLTFASPDVSSLGRYGEIPVGHYTGVPKIDIPIYELVEGDIKIPISLSYHASGIRVQDIASSAGLGWSLNAGGMIMREIRDIPDDEAGGFYNLGGQTVNEIAGFMQPLYANSDLKKILGGWDLPSANQKLKLSDIVNKEFDPNWNCQVTACATSPGFYNIPVDGQSDIYSFNTPSGAGKFFYKNNGEILLLPLQNFKVESEPFRITDQNGLIYTFKTEGERSIQDPWTFSTDITHLAPRNYETSWSLEKVEDKSLNSVKFKYSRQFIAYNTLSSESSIPFPPKTIYSLVSVSSDRLDSITSSNYKIVFYSKTNREDLGGSSFQDEMLDSIKVFNSENKVIKFVKLYHSYFVGVPTENITWSGTTWGDNKAHLRLRLDSIIINKDQVYRFNYDETQLPSRFSKKMDLWGYYNGAVNATLIPTFFGTLDFSGRNHVYVGGNRRPNPGFSQAGILKTVTYPTGGRTEFEYEPNEVKDRKHHVVPELVPIQSTADVFIFSGTSATIPVTRPFNIRYGYLGGTIKITPLQSTAVWWDKVKIEFIDAATNGANYSTDITPYWGTGDVRTINIPTNVPGDYLIRVKGTGAYAMIMLEISWTGPVEEITDPALIESTVGNHFVYPGGTNTISYSVTVGDMQGEIHAWASSDFSNDIQIEIVDEGTAGAIFHKIIAPPTSLAPTVTLLPDKPGNYVLKAHSNNPSAFFHMEVVWKDMGPVFNRIVGGLRVKKIIDYDPLTESQQITTYKYRSEDNEEISSGEIFNYPVHHNERLVFTVLDDCSLTYNPANLLNVNGLVNFTSYSAIPLVMNTESQIGYSSVIVEKGSAEKTRSTYTYSNISSNPDFKLYPGYDFQITPYISVNWNRGLLLSEKHFLTVGNNVFSKIQETTHYYKKINTLTNIAYSSLGIALNSNAQLFYNENATGGAQRIQNCLYSDGIYSANLINWRPYLLVTGWNTMDSTVTKIYSNNQELKTTTAYQYSDPTVDGYLLVREKSKSLSNGSFLKEMYRYPLDYKNLTSSNDVTSGIQYLQNVHIISPVIESCSFIKGKNDLHFKLTESIFVQFHPAQGLPKNLYKIESNLSLSDFSISSAMSGSVIKDSRYQLRGVFNKYTTSGKIQELQKTNDVKTSYLWGYGQQYVVAEVSNAAVSQIFFTGFEADGVAGEAHTGRKYLNSGTYAIPFAPPSDGVVYKMSYWYWNNNQWNFSGEIPFNATISQGFRLDDIRIYPFGAAMSTYTYDPGIGMTSVSDANNVATFYEYDVSGRLRVIKDDRANILKAFYYHHQGQ